MACCLAQPRGRGSGGCQNQVRSKALVCYKNDDYGSLECPRQILNIPKSQVRHKDKLCGMLNIDQASGGDCGGDKMD